MLFEPYWSNPVRAIRITSDNIGEIAEMTTNEVKGDGLFWSSSFRDKQLLNLVSDRVTDNIYEGPVASVGDWFLILDSKSNFAYRFHTDEEFKEKFLGHKVRLENDEQYSRVFQLVIAAMQQQAAATYHSDTTDGLDLMAMATTQKILEGF